MIFFHPGAVEFKVQRKDDREHTEGRQWVDVTPLSLSPANYDSRCEILQVTCDSAALAFFFYSFFFFLIALFKARTHNGGLSIMFPWDKCEPGYKEKQLCPC